MKLLFCEQCGSVFSLGHELKQCDCGTVKGRYINSREAEVNGMGVSLAIGNGALQKAIIALIHDDSGNREDMIEKCKVTHCWVRPHAGEGNPHTIINPNL